MFEVCSAVAPSIIGSIPWWFYVIIGVIVAFTLFVLIFDERLGSTLALIDIAIFLALFAIIVQPIRSSNLDSYYSEVSEYYKANVATCYGASLVDSDDAIYCAVGNSQDDTWTSAPMNCVMEDGTAGQVKLIASDGVVSMYRVVDDGFKLEKVEPMKEAA